MSQTDETATAQRSEDSDTEKAILPLVDVTTGQLCPCAVIELIRHDVDPPVFVAGSMTGWQLVEMTATDERGKYVAKFDNVDEGEHQYKFKSYASDAWFADSTKATVDDGYGSMNNVLVVEHSISAAPQPVQGAAAGGPEVELEEGSTTPASSSDEEVEAQSDAKDSDGPSQMGVDKTTAGGGRAKDKAIEDGSGMELAQDATVTNEGQGAGPAEGGRAESRQQNPVQAFDIAAGYGHALALWVHAWIILPLGRILRQLFGQRAA